MKAATSAMLLLLTCAFATPATARQAPVSVDATIGLSHGSGGSYVDRTGLAMDVLLAARVGSLGRHALVAGLNAGLHGSPLRTDVCVIAPDGGCVPSFPLFLSGSAVAGVELPLGRSNARVLAGPAWLRDAEEGDNGYALQARLDAAVPLVGRARLVGSLRALHLPAFRGDALTVTAAAVGIRLQ